MTTERYDAVIIGAGLGGLSAAGYLAKAGKRVLVLEHHTVPGGYAHEFRRGHYRFEVALHTLDGVSPGGWSYDVLRDLDVLDQVDFHRIDPFYTIRLPEHEITVPADILAYEAELIRHFPHEADGIRNIFDAMMQVYTEVRRFMWDGVLDRRPPLMEMPTRFANMMAAQSQSWGEFMDQYIDDDKLKGAFSALWGYFGLPPSTLNAATFIFPWVSYHLYGAYYPEGGSMAMSRALEKTIKQHDGDIRYRQRVSHIELRDGRAVAVETEKGLRVEADLIISNANAPDTMLKMVGREYLPEDYNQQIEEALDQPALSNLVLYLGLDRDLIAEGWNHHELFIADSYDPEIDYQAAQEGRFEDTGFVITHYNPADPTCAPAGGSVVAIFSLAPWDYANQWGTGGDLENYSKNPQYLEIKQDAAEKILERAAPHLPGLRESIKYMEVGTPLTNVRYSLNPGGSIYGSEQRVDNMYMNRLNAQTPIPNLLLTGAWVQGGGMSAAMLSGRSAARSGIGILDGKPTTNLLALDLPVQTISSSHSPEEITMPNDNQTSTIPDITLTAAGSDRHIALAHIGIPTVLIFHDQSTAGVIPDINKAVRNAHPLASSVVIASVIDLKAVPKLFRSVAKREMKKSYTAATEQLPADMAPADYILILPDWDGSVHTVLGISAANENAAIAVLDGSGNVIGIEQSGDLPESALTLLKQVA